MKNIIDVLGDKIPTYLIKCVGKMKKGEKYRTLSLMNDFKNRSDGDFGFDYNEINTFESLHNYFDKTFDINHFTETLEFTIVFTDNTVSIYSILITDVEDKINFIEYYNNKINEFDEKLKN